MFEGDGVVAVEWAERWIDAPPHSWTVRLALEGDDERRIAIERV
jgi:tRNA A37 threonylcarbamoyladenosine biosynthesis protein TsaE